MTVGIFHKYTEQYFKHFPWPYRVRVRVRDRHGSVEPRPLLKGNRIINSKEHNGGRKAHVKFSLLITTSHTMEALPRRAFPEMCRSLSRFQLAPLPPQPPPENPIVFVLSLHVSSYSYMFKKDRSIFVKTLFVCR